MLKESVLATGLPRHSTKTEVLLELRESKRLVKG